MRVAAASFLSEPEIKKFSEQVVSLRLNLTMPERNLKFDYTAKHTSGQKLCNTLQGIIYQTAKGLY